MFSIPVFTQADLLSALIYIKNYYQIPGSPADIFLIIKNFQCGRCPDGKVVEVRFDSKEKPNPQVCFKILPPIFPRLPSENHYLVAKVDREFFRGLRDFEYHK